MTELPPVLPAPSQRTARPDVLFITSSRAQPVHLTPNVQGEPQRDDLRAHLIADNRAPFHLWLDTQGYYDVFHLRVWQDVVLPDGCGRGVDLIANRLLILCCSGWYGAGAVGLVGLPRLSGGMEKRLATLVGSFRHVLGPWDFGSPLAGDPIERFVRKLRGEPESYLPNNRYLLGDRLADCRSLRQSLKMLGYHCPAEDGAWHVEDQAALLAFQTQRGLQPSGWLDLFTLGSLREALDKQPMYPNGHESTESTPALVAMSPNRPTV